MGSWLAELLAVKAEEAMRRYELTESGWVAPVSGPFMNTRVASLGPKPLGTRNCW